MSRPKEVIFTIVEEEGIGKGNPVMTCGFLPLYHKKKYISIVTIIADLAFLN